MLILNYAERCGRFYAEVVRVNFRESGTQRRLTRFVGHDDNADTVDAVGVFLKARRDTYAMVAQDFTHDAKHTRNVLRRKA
jgi:hypothetical protein